MLGPSGAESGFRILIQILGVGCYKVFGIDGGMRDLGIDGGMRNSHKRNLIFFWVPVPPNSSSQR